jgi:aryl carrier-like protein
MQLLPQETASTNIAGVRDRLCERLPAYMIPSLWIAIARFPLMPSGKMDRRRVLQWLEHLDQDTYRLVSTMGSEVSGNDSVSAVESKLQTIFAKVLNLPTSNIRLNQSFLHLGGDSIAAMQVSSQCRAQGFPISVQDIIRSKSITALAGSIDQSREDHVAPEAVECHLPFDLSPIQKVFFETVGDSHQHFNQTEIFRIARTFEADEIRAALTALVEIHPMLRGRFAKTEAGIWQQRVEKDSTKSFRLCHHRVQAATDATLRPILDDSQVSLDVRNGPLFAVDLFDIDDSFSQVSTAISLQTVRVLTSFRS